MKIVLIFLLFFIQLGTQAIASPLGIYFDMMCRSVEDPEQCVAEMICQSAEAPEQCVAQEIIRRQEEREMAQEMRKIFLRLSVKIPITGNTRFQGEMDIAKWACENHIDFEVDNDSPVSPVVQREIVVKNCIFKSRQLDELLNQYNYNKKAWGNRR